MQVVLAEPRGFCAGVVRAIEIVERALARYGAPVYVRHEIVHNRHVVQALESRGARFVEELDEIPAGAVTVFSAHGVSKAVERMALQRGLPVIDATCPLVSKVHVQARRFAAEGRTLVLIGHAGHAEVDGTVGQVAAPVHLVQSAVDVERLPIGCDAPVAYVTQTTLSVEDTRATIAALKQRFTDLEGPETSDICYATQNRQAALRELARRVDVILVVGAHNSSNSNRLVEIARECGVPAHLLAAGRRSTRAGSPERGRSVSPPALRRRKRKSRTSSPRCGGSGRSKSPRCPAFRKKWNSVCRPNSSATMRQCPSPKNRRFDSWQQSPSSRRPVSAPISSSSN